MKNVALLMLCLGLMLVGGGVAYGLHDVKIIASDSCGSAFSDNSNGFAFTDTGTDGCAAARSGRTATAQGVIVAGGVALLMAAIVGSAAAQETERRKREAMPTPPAS